MNQLTKAISENFSVVLSGCFGLLGVFLGWYLNYLTTKYQNKPQLSFFMECAPYEDLTEPVCRTKTSPSEWNIRIFNTGKTPCIVDSFTIMRKNHALVYCFEVCGDYTAILPYSNIVYTLMEQDARELERNFRKHYKKAIKVYFSIFRVVHRISFLRRYIYRLDSKQADCRVIARQINGEEIISSIDLSPLRIRHSTRYSADLHK